jgi:hypothetical protein
MASDRENRDMFTWLNKQGVRSDNGFEVQSIDRYVIEYREKGKRVSVEVDRGVTAGMQPCINIHAKAFSKWDNESSVLPEELQKQMLQNFTEAMKFQGIEVIVYDD